MQVVKTTLQCGGKDAMQQGVWGIMRAKYKENPALLFNGLVRRCSPALLYLTPKKTVPKILNSHVCGYPAVQHCSFPCRPQTALRPVLHC